MKQAFGSIYRESSWEDPAQGGLPTRRSLILDTTNIADAHNDSLGSAVVTRLD
jgi:hypothetical protein